jgi:nicotinate-nucleotide adenylyltransferase
MGGTFDPPHYGHLVAAEEAADQLGLERVLFLPAGRPPHKLGELISPVEVRVQMVAAAIADNPRFELSLVDTDPARPAYTVDLLERLRAELGARPELYFLVGMDSLRDLPTWHQPERVLERCILVAVTRPGYSAPDLDELATKLPAVAERVVMLETPGVQVSASDLRARVANGHSTRYLTPEPVRQLIERERLYRD